MPPSKQSLPAYTEKLYDLCDVFDRVAERSGARAAEVAVDRLLGQTVKSYPKSAAAALGKAETAHLLTTFKDIDLYEQAVAVAGQDVVDQALKALIARAGPAPVQRKLTDGQSPVMKAAAPASVLEAIVNGQPLTSVRPSAPAYDALAAALGADQKGTM